MIYKLKKHAMIQLITGNLKNILSNLINNP